MAESSPQFQISLPATSANLGPAFDAAALALKLRLSIHACSSSEFAINASGRDAEACASLEHNLILETYKEVLNSEKIDPVPLTLEIENEIPVGKGFGSSASAILAGLSLAVHFGKLAWSDDRILQAAAAMEGHPDNVAACWLGGLTVARMTKGEELAQSKVYATSICPRVKWPLMMVIPSEALPTERARRVLPANYPVADVVANIQSAMLLVAAFVQGRQDLLSASLHDRMHEPYRLELCPLLPVLRSLAGQHGVLGAILSGAGPSVLLFLDPLANTESIAEKVELVLRSAGLPAELLLTEIEMQGAACSRTEYAKERMR